MASASSASDIDGRAIFLTMTELPESDAATSRVLMPPGLEQPRMLSATAAPVDDRSVDDAVGGIGSDAKGRTPDTTCRQACSSTALTAARSRCPSAYQ